MGTRVNPIKTRMSVLTHDPVVDLLPPEIWTQICSHLQWKDLWDNPPLFPFIQNLRWNRYDYKHFEKACCHGKLAFAAWVSEVIPVERNDVLLWYRSTLHLIARKGHLHILKWLKQRYQLTRQDIVTSDHCTHYNAVFLAAAGNGHLHILKWVTATFQITYEEAIYCHNAAFHYAVRDGHLHILQWLTITFNFGYKEATIECRSLINLKAYYKNAKFKPTHRDTTVWHHTPFQFAALRGHLHVLEWMTETFGLSYEDVTSHDNVAFKLAAAKGHLPVLKWMTETFHLTTKDVATCQHFAFEWAVLKGHLEVAQWLTETFSVPTEESVIETINSTALNGDLHILQWLVKHFQIETLSLHNLRELVLLATKNEHSHVVRWVRDHFDFTEAKENAFVWALACEDY